jgi:hypothetical protein
VAYQELDRSLKASAKEINKLREELSFYRNIISPENKVAGLKVDRLHIERTGKPGDNAYRYKLVLIQSLKHDHTIYGRVRLEVNGARDGKDAVLSFPGSNEKSLNLNFKYFQEFEGVMTLPSNFQPAGIKVSIATTSPVYTTNLTGANPAPQSPEWRTSCWTNSPRNRTTSRAAPLIP